MKKKKTLIFIIFLLLVIPNFALAKTVDCSKIDFCAQEEVIDVFKILANILVIIKIMVPVLIIILGVKNLATAVISEDETDIKKYTSVFITRFIVGCFIFFIPTIVSVFLGYADGYENTNTTFAACAKCLNNKTYCDKIKTVNMDKCKTVKK